MNIIISNAKNQPIYEQVYTQIKNRIIADDLKEGEQLPSIRNLAKDLKISVITTKKAYEELERDGYIHTVQGKGSYVAEKNTELLRETYLREIEEYMRKILELAPVCQLSNVELMELFQLLQNEK